MYDKNRFNRKEKQKIHGGYQMFPSYFMEHFSMVSGDQQSMLKQL
jgi:hypothetical protein